MYKKIFLVLAPLLILAFEMSNERKNTKRIEKKQKIPKFEEFKRSQFIHRIEKYSKKHDLIIQSIHHNQKYIDMKIQGISKELFTFIVNLEQNEKYVQVETFDMKNDALNIQVNTGNKLNQKHEIVNLEHFQDPFVIIQKNSIFNLQAIIGQMAIIDSHVLLLGEHYKGYIVSQINTHDVIMKQNEKIIILKLQNV